MRMVCFGNHGQLNIKKEKKKTKYVLEGSGSSLLIISS